MFGVLVGCKADLRDESGPSAVSKGDAVRAASDLGLTYFETSAVRSD